MISAAICDDDPGIMQVLSAGIRSAFEKRCLPIALQSFSDFEKLLTHESEHFFDVIFLDIDMPGIDGVRLGHILREDNSDICIIYISNQKDRVFEALATAPLRFIRKSHFADEIDDAVGAIAHWWEEKRSRFLLVSVQGGFVSVSIVDILYIECFSKVQRIITADQAISVKATMSEFEEKLAGRGFINPYKGYLVNYKAIISIEYTGIRLRNGVLIPLSRYKATEIKKEYLRLVSGALSNTSHLRKRY